MADSQAVEKPETKPNKTDEEEIKEENLDKQNETGSLNEMPKKRKSLAYKDYSAKVTDVLELMELPINDCGANDVIIKVYAASMNPADYKMVLGAFKKFIKKQLSFVYLHL